MTRHPVWGTVAVTLIGAAWGVVGFFLAAHKSTAGMGVVMFGVVPIVIGIAIAFFVENNAHVATAALLSAVAALGFLIALGKEGFLCAVLASPWLLGGLALGIFVGRLLERRLSRRPGIPGGTTVLLAAPLLIFGARQIEIPYLSHHRAEVVETTVYYKEPIDEVWQKLLASDHVEATPTWMMHVGLPVPKSCVLEGRGVGAKRTCYFDVGHIDETVTAWQPPNFMGLRIDRTAMPGRHWLGFEQASYTVTSEGAGTAVTRKTVITSDLAPAIYWRQFERAGVEQEHRYIFEDLGRRLAQK